MGTGVLSVQKPTDTHTNTHKQHYSRYFQALQLETTLISNSCVSNTQGPNFLHGHHNLINCGLMKCVPGSSDFANTAGWNALTLVRPLLSEMWVWVTVSGSLTASSNLISQDHHERTAISSWCFNDKNSCQINETVWTVCAARVHACMHACMQRQQSYL